MLTEKIVGECGVPDVPVGRTESTPIGRLVYAVRVLRLDLPGLRGRAGAHGLRRALGPLAMHATVARVTHRAVLTRRALARDTLTLCVRCGREEPRDDPPQGFQLSEYLVHLP